MDLKELQTAGGFVDTAPVKKTISWTRCDSSTDGKSKTDTFDILVVQQSFGEMEKALDGIDDEKLRMSKLISMCVRLGKDGSEKLSVEDASKLKPSLGTLLANAVNEVMGFSSPKS